MSDKWIEKSIVNPDKLRVWTIGNEDCSVFLHHGGGVTIVSKHNKSFEVIIIIDGEVSYKPQGTDIFVQKYLKLAEDLPQKVKEQFGGCFGLK